MLRHRTKYAHALIDISDPEIVKIAQDVAQECEETFYNPNVVGEDEMMEVLELIQGWIGCKGTKKKVIVYESPWDLEYQKSSRYEEKGEISITYRSISQFLLTWRYYYRSLKHFEYVVPVTILFNKEAKHSQTNIEYEFGLCYHGLKRSRLDFELFFSLIMLHRLGNHLGEKFPNHVPLDEIGEHIQRIKRIIRTFWLILYTSDNNYHPGLKPNHLTIVKMPTNIRRKNGSYHCEGGPALEFPNGYTEHYLNGVAVPQWIAETKVTELNPRDICQITNAQVRAEFVRKVGIEKLINTISRGPIDRMDKYELHRVYVGNGRVHHYLKMRNPSCPDVWHVEAVPPSCKTVADALLWRSNLSSANVDNRNGANWYQQGDVLLFPEGAKKFKSRPVILT